MTLNKVATKLTIGQFYRVTNTLRICARPMLAFAGKMV